MSKNKHGMQSRLPEHFLLQLVKSLAPSLQLVAVLALKNGAQQSKNDTLRSTRCRLFFQQDLPSLPSSTELSNTLS